MKETYKSKIPWSKLNVIEHFVTCIQEKENNYCKPISQLQNVIFLNYQKRFAERNLTFSLYTV